LPGLSGGEGMLECSFDHYRPVAGEIPVRARSGPDPFFRREYLHRVQRKLAVSAPEED
jgi:ribosomal protection tetracycline resistance protein